MSSLIRPQVMAFAVAMEEKLRKKDRQKAGWTHCSHPFLLRRLDDEVRELHNANSHTDIMAEAVDVANFAMMVFDNNARYSRSTTTGGE